MGYLFGDVKGSDMLGLEMLVRFCDSFTLMVIWISLLLRTRILKERQFGKTITYVNLSFYIGSCKKNMNCKRLTLAKGQKTGSNKKNSKNFKTTNEIRLSPITLYISKKENHFRRPPTDHWSLETDVGVNEWVSERMSGGRPRDTSWSTVMRHVKVAGTITAEWASI